MKHNGLNQSQANLWVAPFTGARVETNRLIKRYRFATVAPFTGARVETNKEDYGEPVYYQSLPSRERELKPMWSGKASMEALGRSLHGSAS